MSEYAITQVFPGDKRTLASVDDLLRREGITRDANLDYISAMLDEDGEVIATGSCFGNTLRCFAVSSDHQGEGLLNEIVSHLMEYQMGRGNSHLFLYTKVKAARFFESLGFYEIARVEGTLVFMENRRNGFPNYLKALEPEEWHNEQEKIRQLMPYKLPAKLVEYLKTGPLRLEFPERELVKWAELYSFMDVQEMTWKRKKLLSLMVQMDNYSDYLLLWSPRDKKLWYLDIEHEEFHPLAKWDDFIADPGRYLNGMIEGEFEK